MGTLARRRWQNYLNNDIKQGGWSEEEDRVLLEGHALHGNRWTEIAKMVTGRTDNAVKNRHAVLVKKEEKAEGKSSGGGGGGGGGAGSGSRGTSTKRTHDDAGTTMTTSSDGGPGTGGPGRPSTRPRVTTPSSGGNGTPNTAGTGTATQTSGDASGGSWQGALTLHTPPLALC